MRLARARSRLRVRKCTLNWPSETTIMTIRARARVRPPIDHARKTKNIQMTHPLIFNCRGIDRIKGSHKFPRDHFLIKISFEMLLRFNEISDIDFRAIFQIERFISLGIRVSKMNEK